MRERITFVVEPDEVRSYAEANADHEVVSLPRCGAGIAFARNSIKDLSEQRGETAHWQVDDDVIGFRERSPGKPSRRIDDHLVAMGYAERLFDSHVNVAAVGLASLQWPSSYDWRANQMVYSVFLVRNGDGLRWRSGAAEDADYSLQVLASGSCTIVVNLYRANTSSTASMPGGNTEIEYGGDRRVARFRELQRLWPGVGIDLVRRAGTKGYTMNRIWSKFPQRPIEKLDVA